MRPGRFRRRCLRLAVKLVSSRPLLILDLDIENRPLTYLGQDFTTSDVTAIAAGWSHQKRVHCWVLGQCSTEEMLTGFVALYDRASIVTGHYIRKHDLPIINGALMEFGMKPLSPKLTSDTKNDLLKRSGISASQESLAGMLGVEAPKYGMSQTAWREANRLTAKGIALTRQRVIADIHQHRALRAKMIEMGMLGHPRWWRP
jgi:hypothetical protein